MDVVFMGAERIRCYTFFCSEVKSKCMFVFSKRLVPRKQISIVV